MKIAYFETFVSSHMCLVAMLFLEELRAYVATMLCQRFLNSFLFYDSKLGDRFGIVIIVVFVVIFAVLTANAVQRYTIGITVQVFFERIK